MMKTGKILMDKDPERLRIMFDEVNAMVNESLEETRRILRVFRSIHEPSRVGLKALAALVKNFEMINTLKVELNLGNLPWTLGDHLDTILLHFVQEGITNAFRHGQADHIRISLWRSLEGIIATVWDNGSGISTELQEGIGIQGMRERLAGVGGTLAAQNVVDGFLLKAFIPLRMEALSGSD
jgi:signal transduction histidine kinase